MDACTSEPSNDLSREHNAQLTPSRQRLCALQESTHYDWSPERSLWQVLDRHIDAQHLLLGYNVLATDASATPCTNQDTNQLPPNERNIASSNITEESLCVASDPEGSQVRDFNLNTIQLQCWQHGCNRKEFSSLSNYRRHCREKKLNRLYTCPRCGRSFSRTAARDSHYQKRRCRTVVLDSNGIPSWVSIEQ